MTDTKPILTPDEVAKYLRLAPDTVYRYIRQGKLVASRMGRQYRVTRESVAQFLVESETANRAEPMRVMAEEIPVYSLSELLEGLTEENRHEETQTGPAVGAEVW
ncbi:MAG TPA: helix-turn-helix domain-containing protein [Anaerolineae bacterium]|nr:helix-turn-helix domain-containing protein [Anaerolineae bacterium]